MNRPPARKAIKPKSIRMSATAVDSHASQVRYFFMMVKSWLED
jgi:hypothetical protein